MTSWHLLRLCPSLTTRPGECIDVKKGISMHISIFPFYTAAIWDTTGRMETSHSLWVCFPPPCPWIGIWIVMRMFVQCEGFEDLTLVRLLAIEENPPWEVESSCSKTRG